MQKKKCLAATLLAFSFMFVSTVPTFARDHHDKCEKRIRHAEDELHKAERKHGEHSRQAEQKREKLERERANCH